MEILPGTTLGSYAIDREIGRGGMGVVYLGHDTKLDRKVAIKALPEHLAQDPERLARFEREARTLAALSHPNVAGIYGVEEADENRYLVLEYVEGETLAERLDRGALPVDETIEVCTQIAEGVEAAHEAGVIHRDLKPANIKITPDGQVKVLDFGLAKSTEVASSSSIATSQGPTRTMPTPVVSPTNPGAILGTAPYMSPEQARGRSVDKRTDIWSFGVILYECLTGIGPFVGETATDSIGAILHKEIDLDLLPTGTPAMVRHVLLRCLERDKNKRLRDIGDARLELGSAELGAIHGQGARQRGPGSLVGVALLSLVVGGGLVGLGLRAFAPHLPARSGAEPRRYTITLPETAPIAPPSAYPFGVARPFLDISPDGKTMIYGALVDDGLHLYTRDMATGRVQPVPGGRDGFGATFSPDGSQIAFFANERLWTMNLERRTEPEALFVTSSPRGLEWGEDGTLYFASAESTPITKIPAAGGTATNATILPSSAAEHVWPRLTPDGETLLFTDLAFIPNLLASPVGEPDQQQTVVEDAMSGWLTPTDKLLFLRGTRLMASNIDPSSLQVQGDPVTVVSDVHTSWYHGQFTMSDAGTLIYASGMKDTMARFAWVDREGESVPLDVDLQVYMAFALSSDARRLAVPIIDGQDTDIWVYDLERPRTPARITFGGVHNNAIWSSDGRHMLFGRYGRDGSLAILAKEMQSIDPPFAVFETSSTGIPLEYHAPSGELLFSMSTDEGALDLMRITVDLSAGSGAIVDENEALRATQYGEVFAGISPDRNWIVVNSDETGRWELFISTYPDFNMRTQLSTAGGEEPLWTADGSRVIYRWNDAWYEVDVETNPALRISPPRQIVKGPYINVPGYSWDMSPDGERFLLLEGPQQDTPITQLQVITNFYSELERLLPADD